MKRKVTGYLDVVNPILFVCNHLFADKHTQTHRMIIGLIIMPIGVSVSKLFPEYAAVHLIFDMIGYGIHGIGLVPIVDYAILKTKGEDQKVVVEDEEK